MTDVPEENVPPDETEEIGAGIDPVDPLKRDADDGDDSMPGLDPVVTIPPE
jgi:hypothetical protein